MKKVINIHDFNYDLPNERIALYPLEERDQSKLLVYKNRSVSHHQFKDLSQFIPSGSMLVFNNTRVIQARIMFEKDSGATIEVFLLSPVLPSALLQEVMQSPHSCQWTCAVGNLKRWKDGTVLSKSIGGGELTAKLIDRNNSIIEFTWNTDHIFAEVISEAGHMPLPPYLKRNPTPQDTQRYQTVYSSLEGAVAAPTAGLHFTPRIFQSLKEINCEVDFVTLHVSAGTFLPVKVSNAAEHVMHQEQIIVTRQNINKLLTAENGIIPVGTTSMRTLESLYWFGVKLSVNPSSSFTILQEDAYTLPQDMDMKFALNRVLQYMDDQKTDSITGETSIYIMPGYSFRICRGLITNFHQPSSTLILLVAALVGPVWRDLYNAALKEDYRFLSYGDSSLLLP